MTVCLLSWQPSYRLNGETNQLKWPFFFRCLVALWNIAFLICTAAYFNKNHFNNAFFFPLLA
jgi:hypothetical protein